jgi:Na+-transporting NADH:ubiquinone oxidoreductase subunit NqrC
MEKQNRWLATAFVVVLVFVVVVSVIGMVMMSGKPVVLRTSRSNGNSYFR